MTTKFIDSFGRVIGSVRISVVDRCNLRCKYCMPEDGIKWIDRENILSYEEILRIIRIFYKNSVRKFRITGGEPTIRKDIIYLLREIKDQFPDVDLAITTNGLKLNEMAVNLKKAGVDRLNISLDTLDHNRYKEITRRDSFGEVMRGIKKAIEVGFEEIKINAVSIKDFNDDWESIDEFIKFSEETGIEVRFIEIMPFSGNSWENNGFISSSDLRKQIKHHMDLIPLQSDDLSSTSKTWKIGNDGAKIGFISSVSESFCSTCNRIRITADGQLRPCLHNASEYDLKNALRGNISDEEIEELIREGINKKWKEHPDFLSITYRPPVDDREMIRIGG
jgi:cyclic pyranopterin phosphate synthase